MEVLSSIDGPFAFAFFSRAANKIWFGRDLYGRQSLLISKDSPSDDFVLASVTDPEVMECDELRADGIYVGDLAHFGNPGWISLRSWSDEREMEPLLDRRFRLIEGAGLMKPRKITHEHYKDDDDAWVKDAMSENWSVEPILDEFHKSNSSAVDGLEAVLEEAVRKRITKQPRRCRNCSASDRCCYHAKVGVLFSGGLDSAVLAALADRCLPEGEQIDLINVAFGREAGADFGVPDRATAIQALKELQEASPGRRYRLVCVDVTAAELAEERERRISKLLHPRDTVLDDSIGRQELCMQNIRSKC